MSKLPQGFLTWHRNATYAKDIKRKGYFDITLEKIMNIECIIRETKLKTSRENQFIIFIKV